MRHADRSTQLPRPRRRVARAEDPIGGVSGGPSTRFVVLTFPRSGSAWLLSLLNSHPEIRAYRELFLPGIGDAIPDGLSPLPFGALSGWRSGSGETPADRPPRAVSEPGVRGAAGGAGRGFQAHVQACPLAPRPAHDARRETCPRGAPRARESPRRRHLVRGGTGHDDLPPRGGRRATDPAGDARCGWLCASGSSTRSRRSRGAAPSSSVFASLRLEVAHEELVGRYEETVGRVLDFLGASHPDAPLHSDLVPVTLGRSLDFVENADDVRMALGGTRFEWMLGASAS